MEISGVETSQQEQAVSSSDRTLGALTYVFALLVPFLGPLMWLILRKRSRFLAIETTEAANFSLSWILYGVVTTILQVIAFFTIEPLVLVFGLLWFILACGYLIESIKAIYKVSNGELTRHPLVIRFIKKPAAG